MSVIEKNVLRIGVTSLASGCDYSITKWCYLECFPFPKRFKSEGMTMEDFVCNVLSDGGDVFPARTAKVVEGLKAKLTPGSRGTGSNDGKERLDIIAKQYEAMNAEDDDVAIIEPVTKKAKGVKSETAAAYGLTKDMKVILEWNGQAKSGSKAFLTVTVMDGHVHGRLARCCLCLGGRLVMQDDGLTVTCAGAFDETRKSRIPCSYMGSTADCLRWYPCYVWRFAHNCESLLQC